MKTKHAREIRKGIRFAINHDGALSVTKPSDHVYYNTWAEAWMETASTLALRAYFRTFDSLQIEGIRREVQAMADSIRTAHDRAEAALKKSAATCSHKEKFCL